MRDHRVVAKALDPAAGARGDTVRGSPGELEGGPLGGLEPRGEMDEWAMR